MSHKYDTVSRAADEKVTREASILPDQTAHVDQTGALPFESLNALVAAVNTAHERLHAAALQVAYAANVPDERLGNLESDRTFRRALHEFREASTALNLAMKDLSDA